MRNGPRRQRPCPGPARRRRPSRHVRQATSKAAARAQKSGAGRSTPMLALARPVLAIAGCCAGPRSRRPRTTMTTMGRSLLGNGGELGGAEHESRRLRQGAPPEPLSSRRTAPIACGRPSPIAKLFGIIEVRGRRTGKKAVAPGVGGDRRVLDDDGVGLETGPQGVEEPYLRPERGAKALPGRRRPPRPHARSSPVRGPRSRALRDCRSSAKMAAVAVFASATMTTSTG